MTSLHQPHARVVICGDLSRTGRTKPLGELFGFALPMLGAAKREQSLMRHFERERAGRISPVQNNSRRFKGPGNPITRTARVFACRQVSRVSSEGIQFSSPNRRFRSQKPTKGMSACQTAGGSDPTSIGASR